MSVEIVAGTPLADALQKEIEQKFVELEWSSEGLDAASLAEYIVLMLGNAKTAEEIAQELSQDLLQLDPSDQRPLQFVQWLFQRANELANPQAAAQAPDAAIQNANGNSVDPSEGGLEDADMGEGSQDASIPTGPKSMRNGPQQQKSRDRRMLGQLNRALDRSSGADLHKIKGAAGGRINTHGSQLPKGPRAQQRNQNRQMAMTNMMNPMGGLSPQQQMQMMQMYEQQAQMMASILSPQQQQQIFGGQIPGGSNGMNSRGGMQSGRSLADRIQKPRGRGGFQNRGQRGQQGDAMETDATELTQDSSMDVEGGNRSDPAKTVCKWNLKCGKADCQFAHQSPAAPPGTPVDVEDECKFGAACTNHKCTGKHPSPAQKFAHKAEELCKFYPNCLNPSCPFKHPNMPYCRNGADCTVEGCQFTHSTTACKFNPCLNPACPYKHVEGQKQKINNKVWVNPEHAEDGSENKDHVSDRKFVDEGAGAEELIKPEQNEGQAATASNDGIVA